MARIFVGNSEYGALRGKPQYSEHRAGLQLLAVLAIVNPQLPADERVTINEATRPRASQSAFWNDYVRRGAPPAVVAARPFRSKHDGGGNDESRAFDLGGPGGSVISDRAHALIKAVGADYGIHHTGAGFRPAEKWHFEYVPGTARLLASTGPTKQEAEEQDMTARLYRNAKTGEIAVMDPTAGHYWSCPNMGYVNLERKFKTVPDVDPMNLPANEFDHLKRRTLGHRADLAADAARYVWGANVPGYNGDASASRRLAGIDQKAGTAKLDATGLKVTVDETSITNKVVAGVRGLFQKAGS